MLQKDQIFEFITHRLQAILSEGSFSLDNSGLNANDLAIDLSMNRANLSKALNSLWREGKVLKIDGRPTYFLPYEPLHSAFPDVYFSSYYKQMAGFFENVHNSVGSDNETPIEVSLSQPQIQLLTTLNFPLQGYPPLLQFEEGMNEYHFVYEVVQSALETDSFHTKSHFEYIDCSNPDDPAFIQFFTHNLSIHRLNNPSPTLYFLNQVHRLTPDLRARLDRFFINLRWMERQTANKYILAMPKTADPSIFKSFGQVIDIPAFTELTILERLSYIITAFKQMAKKMQVPIRISRDLFKAFCINEIETSYQVINYDLTQALVKSYTRSLEDKSSFCQLIFSDFAFPLIHRSLPKYTSLNIIDAYFDSVVTFDASGFSKIDYIYNQPILKEVIQLISHYGIDTAQHREDLITHYSERMSKLTDYELQILTINTHNTKYLVDKTQGNAYEITLEFLFNQLYLLYEEISVPVANHIRSLFKETFNPSTTSHTALVLLIDSRHRHETYQKLLAKITIPSTVLSLATPMNMKDLKETLHQFRQSQDIVIVTDIRIYQNLDSLLIGSTDKHILSLYPLSIPLVEDIIKKIENGVNLETLSKEIGADTSRHPQFTQDILHENQFLHDFTNNYLKQQLTFLDANKAVTCLYPVLTEILKNFKLPHTHQFVVKFLVHVAFMIERCIREDTLFYPDLNEYFKNHAQQIRQIERELTSIEEVFGIQIPLSEIAYICDIFVQN